MPQRPYVIDVMISAKAIAARIEELCDEITSEFGDTNKLVVVGLLRGSFVFIADLVRELDLPIEVDFLEASSYGDGMESSREVRILKDLRGAIEGRDVLVVEDIVDTGPSKWLRLASMKLREVPPGLLDVKGVEQLDLSRNPFKELPARFFELVELRELRLEKAKIRSLDGIGQLTKLEYLNLNESKLKEVPPSIGQLENLRDLRLVETGVEDLPDGIATLQRLERLMITLTPLSRNRARVAELRSMGLPL